MQIRKRKSGKFKILILAIAVILAVFAYLALKYQYLISTPVNPDNNTNISFIIEKGDTAAEIADNLIEKDLIIDKGAFKTYLRLTNKDKEIVTGRFILTQTLTIPEIAGIITDKERPETVVTIPEGYKITDIDKKLQELGLIENSDFVRAVKEFKDYNKYTLLNEEKMKNLPHPLEGYLFPDTYFVDSQNFYSENLIQLMLDNFESKMPETEKDIHEVIIMASIIEKEVRTKEDMPIISGILWKRLENSWVLGADATLLYLKDDNTIDYFDLQEDGPYNTRKNGGLPPGPISNPGLNAINAALNPEESPYWFYLTKPDTGEVVYSVSNEEHNANKAKYLY
jgi:UPF0755 protein